MTPAKWFGACLLTMGMLEPGIVVAQQPGNVPQPEQVIAPAPVVALVAGRPMYVPAAPMVAPAYVPGYVYLPRRAYRTSRFYLPPSAAYRIEVTGPPGIAPSWSTLRSGLDRFPLLGGVELGPAVTSGVPVGSATPPGYGSALQPMPDPVASPSSAAVQQPTPAPVLRPPMTNSPATAPTSEPASPSPAPSGPTEF